MTNTKRAIIVLSVIAVIVFLSIALVFNSGVISHNNPATANTEVNSVSDGTGGVIVAWHENNQIYAQRIGPSCQKLWVESGVIVTNCPSEPDLAIVSDGLGGAIVSWYDTTNFTGNMADPAFYPFPFYCRKIDAKGNLLWSSSSVATGKKTHMLSDGNGGVIIAWDNSIVVYKFIQDDCLYVQKIDASGERLWGDEGKQIVSSTPYQTNTEDTTGLNGTYTRTYPTYEGDYCIARGADGGVFVFWSESQTPQDNWTIGQLINKNGSYVWPDTVLVAKQSPTSAISDGTGGAIVTTPPGTYYSGTGKVGDPLKIHVNQDGKVTSIINYDSDIMTINSNNGSRYTVRIIEDPPTGDLNKRLQTPALQRWDTSDHPVWSKETRLFEKGIRLDRLKITEDDSDGIIIAWDVRGNFPFYGNITAQRVDQEGNLCWGKTGVSVFDIPGTRYQRLNSMFGDDSGGVIIVAILGKNLDTSSVYIERLDENGNKLWKNGIKIN